MAQTPEAKVKAKIKDILKKHNVYYAMPMGTGFGNSGVPDFLCCVNGKFLAIEAKAGKGTTTALQEKNLERIKECGGLTAVIYETNVEDFRSWIDKEMQQGGSI
jgi:pantoate kinase